MIGIPGRGVYTSHPWFLQGTISPIWANPVRDETIPHPWGFYLRTLCPSRRTLISCTLGSVWGLSTPLMDQTSGAIRPAPGFPSRNPQSNHTDYNPPISYTHILHKSWLIGAGLIIPPSGSLRPSYTHLYIPFIIAYASIRTEGLRRQQAEVRGSQYLLFFVTADSYV
jgi:hypothetical protein